MLYLNLATCFDLRGSQEEKRIRTTNPQHKQDLKTKIHKSYAPHSSTMSRRDNKIRELLSHLTILNFEAFLIHWQHVFYKIVKLRSQFKT